MNSRFLDRKVLHLRTLLKDFNNFVKKNKNKLQKSTKERSLSSYILIESNKILYSKHEFSL